MRPGAHCSSAAGRGALLGGARTRRGAHAARPAPAWGPTSPLQTGCFRGHEAVRRGRRFVLPGARAKVLASEERCSSPSPPHTRAAQPAPLAGDTGRAGSPGGRPGEASRPTTASEKEHKLPPPAPMAGDAAGHVSQRFKRRQRGLIMVGEMREPWEQGQ